MQKRNFNEALKQRELREREENARRAGENEMTLDDAARVKVLSPGMLVFKRFIRNKLAILGSAILIVMFLFAFLGPYFYRYGQTEVFNKYKLLNVNYANAEERSEHTVYPVEELGISTNTKNMFNSIILDMEESGAMQQLYRDEEANMDVVVQKQGENVYTMSVGDAKEVGTYSLENIGKFTYKATYHNKEIVIKHKEDKIKMTGYLYKIIPSSIEYEYYFNASTYSMPEAISNNVATSTQSETT